MPEANLKCFGIRPLTYQETKRYPIMDATKCGMFSFVRTPPRVAGD